MSARISSSVASPAAVRTMKPPGYALPASLTSRAQARAIFGAHDFARHAGVMHGRHVDQEAAGKRDVTRDARALFAERLLGDLDDDILTGLEHFGNELRTARWAGASSLIAALAAMLSAASGAASLEATATAGTSAAIATSAIAATVSPTVSPTISAAIASAATIAPDHDRVHHCETGAESASADCRCRCGRNRAEQIPHEERLPGVVSESRPEAGLNRLRVAVHAAGSPAAAIDSV